MRVMNKGMKRDWYVGMGVGVGERMMVVWDKETIDGDGRERRRGKVEQLNVNGRERLVLLTSPFVLHAPVALMAVALGLMFLEDVLTGGDLGVWGGQSIGGLLGALGASVALVA